MRGEKSGTLRRDSSQTVESRQKHQDTEECVILGGGLQDSMCVL